MSGPDASEEQVLVPGSVRADRADKLLARLYPQLSRSRWQKLLADGLVWTDDRTLSQTDKLRAGDLVQFTVPDPSPLDLRPVAMDLSVLFEDPDLLVIDKPAGMVVHPGAGTGEDTLVHGLLHHCRDSLSGIGGSQRPGIVHRLDKETSGLLIVAKSDRAHQELTRQFADRVVKKHYTALVMGVPDPASGTVDQPIGRHATHRTRMTCRAGGRPARTDYRVMASWGAAASRIDLRIHTGRTHQIRVHMKHLGHPLLGDELYGFKPGRLMTDSGHGIAVPRVMLHAHELAFEHPVKGDPMRIEAPLPDDFKDLMHLFDRHFAQGESR
jgi:23S rRNA pseudouridine1911/1915/1917 synthase